MLNISISRPHSGHVFSEIVGVPRRLDTNEIVKHTDIKSLIQNVRGMQVLLDSDVAMLYGYETKRINETASRNINRFPESFRFRLTQEEVEMLLYSRSQIATMKRGQNVKYLPYAYTEQGIAMLSGLLKNDIAVQVSFGIMQAFVEMRRFISAYGKAFERISTVEYRSAVSRSKSAEIR